MSARVQQDPWQGLIVLLSYGMSGCLCGAAVGLTQQVLGLQERATGASVVGLLVGLALGLGALWLDRRNAAVEAHPALHGAPFLLAVLPLLWLGALVAIEVGSLVPFVVVLVVLGALGFMALRSLGSRALRRALSAEAVEAEARLKDLSEASWTLPAVRVHARHNLGLLALQRGEVEQAVHWLRLVRGGRAEVHAQVALALAYLMAGRAEDAADRIRGMGAAGLELQGELDAVRLLLVWRAEGAAEARAFGERLGEDGAGMLFRALLASLRREAGDTAGATALLEGGLPEALAGSPGLRALPELQWIGARA